LSEESANPVLAPGAGPSELAGAVWVVLAVFPVLLSINTNAAAITISKTAMPASHALGRVTIFDLQYLKL
jgi:hypothetical protein